ncbi:protein-export protein SecB [bacterium BMS3Abin10]|nr:protein-export protein SecB [bacterium BMS3Abin10]GBE38473.1 protein-export protein SecB [bacterium BMS3Bbin08]
MELVRFNIKEIKLVDCLFSLNPKYDLSKEKPVTINSSFDIQYQVNNNVAQLTMKVFSDTETQPFYYNVTLVGLFNFDKIPDHKILDRIVNVNCASILFPYIRETVADLTRRANIPPFHLSPVNFVVEYDKKLKSTKSKKKAARKKPIKPKSPA